MEVNPQWVIPRSIIDKDVAHHAGDWHYFHSRNYYVVDRKTGKPVDFSQVSFSMLRNHNYSVVQRGGKGNSLGRLIFRFDNNFQSSFTIPQVRESSAVKTAVCRMVV